MSEQLSRCCDAPIKLMPMVSYPDPYPTCSECGWSAKETTLSEIRESVQFMRERIRDDEFTPNMAGARLSANMSEQLLEIIDDLGRGRVTEWHCDRVSPEMLSTYLEEREGWEFHEDSDENLWSHAYHKSHIWVSVRENNIIHCIQRIACAESRGELAVWLDILQQDTGEDGIT